MRTAVGAPNDVCLVARKSQHATLPLRPPAYSTWPSGENVAETKSCADRGPESTQRGWFCCARRSQITACAKTGRGGMSGLTVVVLPVLGSDSWRLQGSSTAPSRSGPRPQPSFRSPNPSQSRRGASSCPPAWVIRCECWFTTPAV